MNKSFIALSALFVLASLTACNNEQAQKPSISTLECRSNTTTFTLTATQYSSDNISFSVARDAEIVDTENPAQLGDNGYDDPKNIKPEIAKANAKAIKAEGFLRQQVETRVVTINPTPYHQKNGGLTSYTLFGDIVFIGDGYFVKIHPNDGLQTVNPLKTQVNGQTLTCRGNPEG